MKGKWEAKKNSVKLIIRNLIFVLCILSGKIEMYKGKTKKSGMKVQLERVK